MVIEETALLMKTMIKIVLIATIFIQASATHCRGEEPRTWHEVEPQGPEGLCSVETWKTNFPGCEFEDGVSEGHLGQISYQNDRFWRVTCSARGIGPEQGGVGWRWPFPQSKSSSKPWQELEVRYTVHFEKGFDFVKGGKLPGLCGGPKTITGGDQCTGYDGWSVRIMWRRDGRGQAYAYHPRMKGKYGDEYDFPQEFRFPVNQPVQLRMSVRMNDINDTNGSLRVWVRLPGQAEQLVIERLEMQWTKSSEIGVDSLLFNVFHGGNDRSWAPMNNCDVRIGALGYR